MPLWVLLVVVAVAGACGGVINALLSDNGFVLPKTENGIVRPGFIANILIGAASSVVSWGLYGPYANSTLVASSGGVSRLLASTGLYVSDTNGALAPLRPLALSAPAVSLTLSSVVGAFLVGIAGARWLTNEVDKKLLQRTAVTLAPMDVTRDFAKASPASALNEATKLAAAATPPPDSTNVQTS